MPTLASLHRALGASDDQTRATARRAVLSLLNVLAVKSTFISTFVTALAPKLVNSISQVHLMSSLTPFPLFWSLTLSINHQWLTDHRQRAIRAAEGDGGEGTAGGEGVQQTR
jgi:hypothetical protein